LVDSPFSGPFFLPGPGPAFPGRRVVFSVFSLVRNLVFGSVIFFCLADGTWTGFGSRVEGGGAGAESRFHFRISFVSWFGFIKKKLRIGTAGGGGETLRGSKEGGKNSKKKKNWAHGDGFPGKKKGPGPGQGGIEGRAENHTWFFLGMNRGNTGLSAGRGFYSRIGPRFLAS